MRVRVCVLFLSHEEKKEKRESALCLCRFLFRIFFLLFVGGVAFSPSAREARQTRAQKKEREKREFSCGSKKRDFSDDDDEVVYIFIREEDGAAITA